MIGLSKARPDDVMSLLSADARINGVSEVTVAPAG
jgi:hypothetical protein